MTIRLRLVCATVICLHLLCSGCAGPPPTVPPVEPVPAAQPRATFEKPDNAYYYVIAAQKERRAGRTDSAIMLLRKAIEADPESSYLPRELATVYLQNKEESKALAVLDELLARHPDDVKALILYGGIQQLRKDNDAAARSYEKVLELDPSQERIYTILGGLYLEAGDLPNAARVLGRLVEKFPNSFSGHFLLGRMYLSQNKPALAEKAFRRSAQADPESVEPLFELLKLAREQGRRPEAAKLNREILDRDPENSRALLEMALFERQTGRTAEADGILKSLGERSRTEFEVILQVIQGYVDPKKFDNGLYLLNGMLKGAPESADLHYLKGFCFFGQKKNAEALPEFRQVNPESRFYQDALVHTAFILQEQGRTDEAIAELQALLEKNPENGEVGVLPRLGVRGVREARRGRAAAASGTGQGPGQHPLPLPPRGRARQTEEQRGVHGHHAPGDRARPPPRERPQLPRLHVRGPRAATSTRPSAWWRKPSS